VFRKKFKQTDSNSGISMIAKQPSASIKVEYIT